MISHIRLKNWRNFREADVALGQRVFLVGPNASGKSNFLDAVRFLHDICKSEGGGLEKAVKDRGGMSKIKCLAAGHEPNVEIEVDLCEKPGASLSWRYAVGIKREASGSRRPIVAFERVWKGSEKHQILDRPDSEDRQDAERLTQTHLQQTNANRDFREVAQSLGKVSYVHLVPQLVRFPRAFSGPGLAEDPFGRNLLEKMGQVTEKTRKSRLAKIEKALRVAVPQLKDLNYLIDVEEGGVPHLEAVYEHWRARGAHQREMDFSDGTLRFMGLLWSLFEGDAPLLLEEPELSLHTAIIRAIPGLIHRLTKKNRRQVFLSTHSAEMLSDTGIGPDEVILLLPSAKGTEVKPAAQIEEVRALLEGGMTLGEAVMPRTEPADIQQLSLFE
jgi:predicted ATPase